MEETICAQSFEGKVDIWKMCKIILKSKLRKITVRMGHR